jgi:hypothetical protein
MAVIPQKTAKFLQKYTFSASKTLDMTRFQWENELNLQLYGFGHGSVQGG